MVAMLRTMQFCLASSASGTFASDCSSVQFREALVGKEEEGWVQSKHASWENGTIQSLISVG